MTTSRVRGTITLGTNPQQRGPQIGIVNGPPLAGYLNAVMINDSDGTGSIIITLVSKLNRFIDRSVTITHSECEDGSGQLFNFRGTWQRPGFIKPGASQVQKVEGFYNARAQTGWIRSVD